MVRRFDPFDKLRAGKLTAGKLTAGRLIILNWSASGGQIFEGGFEVVNIVEIVD